MIFSMTMMMDPAKRPITLIQIFIVNKLRIHNLFNS